MGLLQDELNRLIEEQCTEDAAKVEVLRLIMRRKGLSLTDLQLKSIVDAIEQNDGSSVVEIDGSVNAVTISDDDVERAQLELVTNLGDKVDHVTEQVMERIAPSMLQSLYAALPRQLREQRAIEKRFEKRLRLRWQRGLDRLEMLIIMAHEAGEIYVEVFQHEFVGQVASEESVLFDVLVALHYRACRTAREIVCLLKSGYADGANARWRSLHELAVTALFLAQHRGDAPQRYHDHAAVQAWRAAGHYQAHSQVLGYEPFSDEEMAEMEQAADDVVTKYGETFKKDYGWAAKALGARPANFAEIEASLDLSHWRPFFGLASQSVHADARGLFRALGLPEDSEITLLAGASDAGLADPGHCAAISLTLASVALLTTNPNLDSLVSCMCMNLVCRDIGDELLRSHQDQFPEHCSPSTT
jgi:Family of unknown function (DUF5677)